MRRSSLNSVHSQSSEAFAIQKHIIYVNDFSFKCPILFKSPFCDHFPSFLTKRPKAVFEQPKKRCVLKHPVLETGLNVLFVGWAIDHRSQWTQLCCIGLKVMESIRILLIGKTWPQSANYTFNYHPIQMGAGRQKECAACISAPCNSTHSSSGKLPCHPSTL